MGYLNFIIPFREIESENPNKETTAKGNPKRDFLNYLKTLFDNTDETKNSKSTKVIFNPFKGFEFHKRDSITDIKTPLEVIKEKKIFLKSLALKNFKTQKKYMRKSLKNKKNNTSLGMFIPFEFQKAYKLFINTKSVLVKKENNRNNAGLKFLNKNQVEEIMFNNRNLQKSFKNYLMETNSFVEKFLNENKKEKYRLGNFINVGISFYKSENGLDKVPFKKVKKIPNIEYNKVKKVFSLKIPLDENTVLKIKAVKNNFYAQINTSAEKVNLLIQNLQTITQQIANLGFVNTVIKVQALNTGGGNTKNNNSSNHNNKDKHAAPSKERIEKRPNIYRTSFSFYL